MRLTTSVAVILGFALPTALAAPCQDPGANAPIPDIALTPVVTGLTNPVHVTGSGDGSGRLFVVEQAGTVRIVDNGRLLASPFLDLRNRVESGGEKGLLSIVFHPLYAQNGVFFVNYTTRAAGKLYTHVSRLTRATADRADAASERVLLKIEQPYANHNGGQLAFGPDGYLYIGMGDGGAANDPHGHGQNLATLLGKMLRLDVDRAQPNRPYAIPADNPFVNQPGAAPEVYAYGLRNPWRFSFDAGSGRLYLADVGQNAKEEIDVIERGGNYGWNVMEGDICTPTVNKNCKPIGTLPIFSYPASEGRSITGGFVYRGARHAPLCGVYLYGDYVGGNVWGLRFDGQRVTAQRRLLGTNRNISSFGQGDDLEVYLVDHRGGIYHVSAPR